MFFLSNETIKNSFNQLVKTKVSDPSLIHIYLILKSCGFNRLEMKSVNDISLKGFYPAFAFSSLFSLSEVVDIKSHDFINPFSMDEWGQNPTEKLGKWVKSRVKNNVTGGATTWRKIVNYDPLSLKIKFKYECIDVLRQLCLSERKINLLAISIWAARFTQFDKRDITLTDLIDLFIEKYKLEEEEISKLFSQKLYQRKIYSSSELYDTSLIRKLIRPSKLSNQEYNIWSNQLNKNDKILDKHQFFRMELNSNNENVSFEEIEKLLNNYFQIILSGPPGTSKSYAAQYIANKLSKENTEVIQFHPSYSYKDFIGGYVVEGQNVLWKKGIFTEFIEQASSNKEQNYIFIIEEFNRANVSQVFGETIQCLDRNFSVEINQGNEKITFSIPSNVRIICTMNTCDRSIGIVDFAIKRRFVNIEMKPDEKLLDNLLILENNIILSKLLKKINNNLRNTLNSESLLIGHAIFINESFYDKQEKKYKYNKKDFEELFNFKVIPLIEDYAKGNSSQINSILGDNLSQKLKGTIFENELENFINNDN